MMKKIIVLKLMLALSLMMVSCNYIYSPPQKVFNVVGLNANVIPNNFTRHFKELLAQKEAGKLIIIKQDNTTVSATAAEYMNEYYTKSLVGMIQQVKDLKPTEESKSIIAAGLEMFEYADEIYKTDYPKIAKMIDDGKSEEEVYAAIQILEDTKGVELDRKYNKTMDLLMPYADKNGVDYKVLDLPF